LAIKLNVRLQGYVNYDSDDRFSLNGQRLVKISSDEYRFEIEQWSKIVAIGSDPANPESWKQYLSDGTIRIFGTTKVGFRHHRVPSDALSY